MRRRMPRRVRALVIILGTTVLLAVLLLLRPRDPAPAPASPAPSPAAIAAPPPRSEIIRPGATLSGLLARYGFTAAEIERMRQDVLPVYNLARLQAGRALRLYPDLDLGVSAFEYDIDGLRYLRVSREGQGFRSEIRSYPLEIRRAFTWGVIEDNLIAAVEKSGETTALALGLAEIFGWDIDFYTDLRAGDRFFAAYEKRYVSGRFAGYGSILAARFTNRGKDFCAVRYAYPDTKAADFFNLTGGSLRKAFLRSPFAFTPRITSRFSLSRLHPIRRIVRPHYGVDYAAPIGTEVRATAAGTVLSAGMNGAAGRMVKIRHANAYVTMYLHLSRIAAGVRTGARVEAGQVIGAVGSSGESTGPHLDYRIQHHGRYINPLSWRFEPAAPLRPEFRADFERTVARYRFLFEAPLVYALRSFLVSLF